MILKAGTYRFNDNVSRYGAEGQGTIIPLVFNVTTNYLLSDFSSLINHTVTYSGISFDGGSQTAIDFLQDDYEMYLSYVYKEEDYGGWAYNLGTPDTLNLLLSYGMISQDTYNTFINYYNDGVYFHGEGIKSVTIPYDQEVEDTAGEWFITYSNYNEVNAPLVTIEYNGSTIAELNAGETATLSCEGKKMVSDVVVKMGEVQSNGTVIPPNYIKPSGSLTITENGTYDVTDKAEVGVDVPQFIDVEALPTENIRENAIYRLVNGSTIGAWRFKENPNLGSFPTGRINFKFSLTYYSIYVDICYGLMAQLGDLCALKSETGETSYRILHTEEGTWASEQEKMFYVLENITNETTLNYINKIADKVDYPLYRYVNGVWVYYSNPYYYINGALTEHPSSLKFGHYVLKNRTNPSLGSTIYGLSMATLNCHFFTYIKVNGEVKLVECKDITVAEGTGDSQGVYKILYGVYEGESTLSHCEVYSTTDEWVYDKSQNIYVIEADEDAIIWLHTHGIKLT